MHARNFPGLYQSGVKWRREEPTGRSACEGGLGQELFLGARQVHNQRHADCEDLAAWRVAEARLGRVNLADRAVGPRTPTPPITVAEPPYRIKPIGADVRPAFYSRRIEPNMVLYHIICVWPDGYVEDPSRRCGMGGSG